MAEETREIGRFVFGIRILRNVDGSVEYHTQSRNESVPIEVVIMQMKAFLRNVENEYFDSFDKGYSRSKQE